MGVSKAFQVFYGAANRPVGHTISLDYDTTLPGKPRITHPISPCIAVAGGRLRVGVGTQSRCARGPPGNLGELGVECFFYTLLIIAFG